MSFIDKIMGNPIERMKTKDIMEEEIRLKNQIERIRKDINRIEKEKKKRFQEGIGSDMIKKKMLTQEIKQLDMEGKLKMKNFTGLHKQYTFITNLITIKKAEKQLKNTPVWNKLNKVKPSQLEAVLIKMNLEGKTFDEMVDGLNRVFEMEIAEFEESEDESEKKMLDMWNAVEAGQMEVEEVEKELSVEKKKEEEAEDEII
jgi:hypothetical protein